jgi:uncharacterized protein (TIGR00290 family)
MSFLEVENEMVMTKAISSWSGGKDSCLAAFEAARSGYQVAWLLTFFSRQFKRTLSHGVEMKVMNEQARAVGTPSVQRIVPRGMEDYEEEFVQAVTELKGKGARAMVFGDIALEEHKEWIEKKCRDLGIEAVEPLWGRGCRQILLDFIAAGFAATVVAADSKIFGPEFVGRKVDEALLACLEALGVDPAGEKGEYHTLVTDGPLFKRRLEIRESAPVLKGDYWFLDIRKLVTKDKN